MVRRFVSMTVFISFLLLVLSTFVLYVIPGGQAGPAAWSFLSLARGQWVDVHIASGFLFIGFGLWHTVLNWRSLASGFRKAAAAGLKSGWPILGALALNFFVLAGALGHWQPVEAGLAFYRQNKQEFRAGGMKAEQKAAVPAKSPFETGDEAMIISEAEAFVPPR